MHGMCVEVPRRSEKGTGFLRAGVTGRCEPPDMPPPSLCLPDLPQQKELVVTIRDKQAWRTSL